MQRRLTKLLIRVFPGLAKLDNQNKDMVRKTMNSMVMRVIRTGISFLFTVLLARMLGATGQGVYEQALNIVLIASIIGRFGMDQAVTRFVAANASQQNWQAVSGIYRQVMIYVIGLSTLAVGVVYMAAPLFARSFDDEALLEPLRWMSFAILPYSVLFIHSQMLQGIERIEDSIFVQTLGVPIVNIPFLLLLTSAYGVVGAAMSYLIATIVIAFLGIRLWRRYNPQLAGLRGDFDRQQLLTTSRSMLLTDITITVFGRFDVLILAVYAPSAIVGIYSQAKRISVLVSSLLTATSIVATPKFSAMYASGQIKQLGALARNVAILTTIVSIPYLIVFVLFPGWVMGIFGAEYAQGGAVLAILSVGQFINAATGANGHLLNMTGNERVMRNITFVTSVMRIALLLLLVPQYGYIGAALATMIGDSIRNIVAVYAIYRLLNMISIPLPRVLVERLTAHRAVV